MATFTNRQLFYVNSSNRLGGTNSNFSYQLNVNPNVEFNKATVLEVSIPKSYYLIEEGYNKFVLWEGLEEVTITIPPANYNRNSLQNTLVTLLNAASIHSWTYSIDYPNTQRIGDTGKFIYKVSGNGVVQPEFHFTNACYEAMGFEENGEYEFVGNQLQSVKCN